MSQGSVVNIWNLPRWSDTTALAPEATSAADLDAIFSELQSNPSRFAQDDKLNKKVILAQAHLHSLDIDAIVVANNESLTDRTGIAGDVFSRAGPELELECQSLEGCRTGEAKMTKGYGLPARHVLHTVGPRYNIKYQTAAENALHSCYRNGLQLLKEGSMGHIAFPCVHSDKKGYPRESGAHIAIRTTRRFLEKWGDSIETVVFCMASPHEMQVYLKVLPLYFPRNSFEELQATRTLPKNTGNELGETVYEERKIRVTNGPVPAGPAQAEEQPMSEEVKWRQAVPMSTTGGGMMVSSDCDSVLNSDFTSMKGDPDLQRRSSGGGGESKRVLEDVDSEEVVRNYAAKLKAARNQNFDDIKAKNILYQAGKDKNGRPVWAVLAANLPEKEAELDRMMQWLICVLDEEVEKEYVVVYLHATMEGRQAKPSFDWLRKTYTSLPRKFKKNLKALYLVHPTLWMKMTFWFFSPFISSKFWHKLVYIEHLQDLYRYFDKGQLKIPDYVIQYDQMRSGDYEVVYTERISTDPSAQTNL